MARLRPNSRAAAEAARTTILAGAKVMRAGRAAERGAVGRPVGRYRQMDETKLHALLSNAVHLDSAEAAADAPEGVEAVMVNHLDDSMAGVLRCHPSLHAIFHMGSSSLTDAGVELMTSLSGLEVLSLEWSDRLTDKSLRLLSRLSSLRHLDISFCFGLSQSAIEQFHRALPDCEIER